MRFNSTTIYKHYYTNQSIPDFFLREAEETQGFTYLAGVATIGTKTALYSVEVDGRLQILIFSSMIHRI